MKPRLNDPIIINTLENQTGSGIANLLHGFIGYISDFYAGWVLIVLTGYSEEAVTPPSKWKAEVDNAKKAEIVVSQDFVKEYVHAYTPASKQQEFDEFIKEVRENVPQGR